MRKVQVRKDQKVRVLVSVVATGKVNSRGIVYCHVGAQPTQRIQNTYSRVTEQGQLNTPTYSDHSSPLGTK